MQREAWQKDCPAVQRLASQSASDWQSAVQNFCDAALTLRQPMFSPTQLSSAVQGSPK
jgi:hypothetical protein